MGKASGRSQWLVVLLLLGGAAIMLAALVFPEWFPDPQRRRSREAAAADLGEASRNETPAAAKAEAAEEEAAPAAVAEAEELPPYGDRSLPQEESLRGRVTNEKGEPVADAIVVAFFREWRSYPYRMVTAGRVRTEADGFFVIGPSSAITITLPTISTGQ